MSSSYGIPLAARNSLVFAVDAAQIPSTTKFSGTDAMEHFTEWQLGTGGIGNWGQNGSTSENSRVYRTDPHGNRAIIWRAYNNDSSSGADGGWNSSAFSITRSNLYRWVRYFKVIEKGANGTIYGGNHGVNQTILQWSDRNTQGNPYDFCVSRGSFTEGGWYAAISYMFPEGTVAGGGGSPYVSDWGFYPMFGANKGVRSTSGFGCNTGGNTIFNTSETQANERQYLYYSTDPTVDIYWGRPKCYIVNGSDPSIADCIASEQDLWVDQCGNSNMRAQYRPVLTRNTNGGYFTFNPSNYTHFEGVQGEDEAGAIPMNCNNVTIQAWINPTNTNHTGHIFEKGALNTQYSLFFSTTAGGTCYFRTYGTSSNDTSVATSSIATAGQWSMITATYDGNRKKLYKNTTEVASDAATGTLSTNSGGCWIGAYAAGTDYFFNGKIACVRVYKKGLTRGEIVQNFQAQRGRFGV
jgi:hypothetical protein